MARSTPEGPLSGVAATVGGAPPTPPRDTTASPPLPSPPVPPAAVSGTPPAAPKRPDASPPSSSILERAVAGLDRLRQDLLGVDPRLVAGRLELASGWIRSDASIRAALV